jgi:hypothetical protein
MNLPAPTTADWTPGTRVQTKIPGTRIHLFGTVVDPNSTPFGEGFVAPDELLIRFDGQCTAYGPTPIAHLVATYPEV